MEIVLRVVPVIALLGVWHYEVVVFSEVQQDSSLLWHEVLLQLADVAGLYFVCEVVGTDGEPSYATGYLYELLDRYC